MGTFSADEITGADYQNENQPERRHWSWLWRLVLGAAVLVALLIGSFEFVYAGKVYPGIVADGVNVGGTTVSEAKSRIEDHVAVMAGSSLALVHDDTTLRVPVNGLNVSYDAAASAQAAFSYGRTGSLVQRAQEQFASLIGTVNRFDHAVYDETKLTPYIGEIVDSISSPVSNAAITYGDGGIKTTDSKDGTRVDIGSLVQMIDRHIATANLATITVPTYGLSPDITSADLRQTAEQAKTYLSAPLELKYGDSSREVDQATIASWINVSAPPARDFMATMKLEDLYNRSAGPTLGLSQAAVTKYVETLATRVDQPAQNAVIAMQDGKLSVVRPSRDGVKIDQPAAVTAITDALANSDSRNLDLKAAITKADVREDNLDSLGIKEQLSEGVSMFPGSTKARITNVAAGAAKFNGVLLKPGEVFSFGKLLGQVDASTGYVPELVILGDHEEKQYGGGLCQVSSTAFRAALNAGLPILERVNHSFAISYYTAPYGVPGVDATIYYPQVDFKFKNDTPGYILMQTTMQGTNLRFDYFGTKTKSGTVRGPEFISGDHDTTKPSKTVFYRDTLDMAGNVTKTDTFYTTYESSLKYPVKPQYN